MYKRLLIFGITGLFFVLALGYLLIYPLNQTVSRERERQDKVYWSTFNAIVHFGAQPDKDSEQKAKAALKEARARGLARLARTFCKITFRTSSVATKATGLCKRANSDMNEAIRAPR